MKYDTTRFRAVDINTGETIAEGVNFGEVEKAAEKSDKEYQIKWIYPKRIKRPKYNFKTGKGVKE